MSSAFERATAIEARGDGVFGADIPDGWQQGKGAYGGVQLGLLVRAMIASEKDQARRLRSLTAEMLAPAMPGTTEVRVRELRRGGSMTFLEATLVQNGDVIARASATLAAARAVPPVEVIGNPAPVMPPWEDVAVVPVQPPFGPVFGAHYEYRSTGPLPFTGGTAATAAGWLREKTRPTVLGEPEILGLLDTWWPSIYAVSTTVRPMVTVGFTMQLLVDPRQLPTDRPLAYRGRTIASHDNFVVETRELWSDGHPVALNQQTMAVLG